MRDSFYITAAIPYVNAKPHIGHALEFIQTNTLARYMRMQGYEVLSTCGGDENALKNVQAAETAKMEVQAFVDMHTQDFFELTKALNATFDVWQKGSSPSHIQSSQVLWERCAAHGDIYRKSYAGLYCVGCEAFYTPSELTDAGECYEHPGKSLETVREENYFFRLSAYETQLIELIESDQLKINPVTRKNEVLSFIRSGLEDISISRSNERARNWGVRVPGDDSQRMYVWFDALNIYQSGIGFGSDKELYERWWPANLHVIGKGIVRFHAVYWPAFLLSAGLAVPKEILVHEYFTVDGQKMSKTVGNVYDPMGILNRYGADPLRYYCLAKMSPFSDGDFGEDKFVAAYNSDLANSLGNTVQRVATLCHRSGMRFAQDTPPGFRSQVKDAMREYRFDRALEEIWKTIAQVERRIDEAQPWKLTGKKLQATLMELVAHLRQVGYELQPFIPETGETMLKIFEGPEIAAPHPLFPRIEETERK